MLFCNTCKCHQSYNIKENGVHKTAYCNVCNSYIKNIPHKPPTFYIGKYKGEEVANINDLHYLKWAKENMRSLSSNMREAIADRIYSLENMLR